MVVENRARYHTQREVEQVSNRWNHSTTGTSAARKRSSPGRFRVRALNKEGSGQ